MSINDTSTTIPPPAYTPRRTPSLETIERVLPTFFNCPATSVASELAPAPANTPGTIPVCPHESLTPARLASILSLPGLGSDPSDASKVLGALTPTPDAHHRRNMVRSRTKGSVKYEARVDCHPLGHTSDIRHDTSGNKLIAVKGFGKFLYDRPQPPKRRRFLRRGPVIEPSLVLHMTWELCVVPRARDRIFTLEEFCKEVEKAKVQLCAHKRLSDPEFTESMFEQFNPFGSLRDPILRHQTRQEGYNCKMCGAQIDFKLLNRDPSGPWACMAEIHTKRVLGQCGSEQWDDNCTASTYFPRIRAACEDRVGTAPGLASPDTFVVS